MTPYWHDDHLTLYGGDCRAVMAEMPAESVNCVVTSPPYWGLRDYGTEGQLGMEATPEAYVANMVDVFREVRRVLRADGTLWLNLGDSYAAQRGGTMMPAETLAGGVGGFGDEAAHRGRPQVPDSKNPNAPIKTYQPHRNAEAIGLKHKDLVGIPWRVAFALQADGWYLRSDIIWAKPNPMPESVTDRPTKSHEYLFLLAKSARYYFDAEAVREDAITEPGETWQQRKENGAGSGNREIGRWNTNVGSNLTPQDGRRNLRTVWTIATEPYPGAHFATFPRKLVEPCVKAGCPDGGTVLDPFAGSGTTLLVAQALGRRGIGIDLSPEYLRQALARNAQTPLGLGA